jgi:hypothetical protein
MNYLAVVKILKKHDKMTPGWALSSDTIIPLMDNHEIYPSQDNIKQISNSLEKIYTKYLYEGEDKSKAMKNLRDYEIPEESHLVTFTAGFSFGIVIGTLISLFLTFMIIYQTTSSYYNFFFEVEQNQSSIKAEFAASIPIFRLIFIIAFQILLWGIDLLVYERRKINARFILDADPRSFLRSNQVVLVILIL